MTQNRYVFDNAATAETSQRFAGLEDTYNSATVRYLTGLGVTDGWACWEIGAGNGSIARWLADRVGPAGSVLASDIDPRFIPPSQLAHLKVTRHDITTDSVPEARYDLIFARLVLSHLPQRRDVAVRLARALRQNGWLLIEDFSPVFQRGSQPTSAADSRMRAVQAALNGFLNRANDNRADFAATLPQLLADLGLADIGAEGRVVFARGGTPAAQILVSGLRQVGDQMIAAGLLDRSALDDAIAYLAAPTTLVSMPTMISAWGRKM